MASVIVIDDEEMIRNTIKDMLKEYFFTLTCATPKEALHAIKSYNFDIAIIDINLPEMSGIELFNRLKSEQPGIEGIVVTGTTSYKYAVEAVNMGIFAYILKPFTKEQLLMYVQRALERKSLLDTLKKNIKVYETIMGELPFPLAIITENKDIFATNKEFSKIFEYEPSAISKPIYEVLKLPEQKGKEVENIIEKIFSEKQTKAQLETKIGDKTFEHRLSLLKFDDGDKYIVFLSIPKNGL